jgi:epoxyqueuosine reductase
VTSADDPLSLAEPLIAEARRLGFDPVGIAQAAAADDFEHLRDWLAGGHAGSMAYMEKQAEARRHPASILPSVRSIVMLGLSYKPPGADAAPQRDSDALVGRIARYAAGLDYHDVVRGKLNALLAWVQQRAPGVQGRGVVDTAPLLERDFARRAGLGWIGKNTMLINKKLGSYLFLGALLLDCDLPADGAFDAQHCGSCTRCLDACPTDAFTGPYRLDARRCISYLTIELRGPVPEELRPGLGDWLFGCDVCQEVCPWNRKAPAGLEPALAPAEAGLTVDLIELLGLSDDEFRRRFRHTALWRTRRGGLLRNAALVLGNLGDARAVPALERALDDTEPLVREAAGWALARLTLPNGARCADPAHSSGGPGRGGG